MSGQLPRSTQYGKKIRLPHNNFVLPNVENGLSPYLGHPVVIDEQNFYNRNGDENSFHIESSISSLSDIESWDTGSTSSASWFDEFDQVATQQINKELRDIDSVLYSEADVSILRSDLHEECQEWKDAFPHLRITGTGVKHFPLQSTTKRKGKDIEETKSFSVISKSSPVLYNSHSKSSLHSKSDKIPNKINNNVIEMESFLRISPISFFDATDKHQTSAASIVRSEITSSKWRRNTSPEFSSLPYIPTNNHIRYNSSSISTLSSSSSNREPNSNRKMLEPLVRKSQRSTKSGKSDHFYQTLPLRAKPLILPPIDQLSITKESLNFRSISATPRNSMFYQGFVENAYRKLGTSSKCTQIVEQQSNKAAYRNNVNSTKDVEKSNVVKPKSNYK